MITTEQIKERLKNEKDPIQYLDREVALCANLMGARCQNVQDMISAYNHRVDENEPFDLEKIKEELKNMGDMYMEINSYLKVRKERVKQQKRTEQVNKAMVKRREWIEEKKNTPNE
ncbi:MAG: hypothetical protein WBZ29_12705 [Methanocella sp.]